MRERQPFQSYSKASNREGEEVFKSQQQRGRGGIQKPASESGGRQRERERERERESPRGRNKRRSGVVKVRKGEVWVV